MEMKDGRLFNAIVFVPCALLALVALVIIVIIGATHWILEDDGQVRCSPEHSS